MSSSPRADRGRWTGRSWSLRARLLAGQLVVLAGVCLIIGVAAEVALHQLLVGQLDGQLIATGNRAANGPPPDHTFPPPRAHPGPEFLGAPGNGPRTLGARISGNHVVEAGVLTVRGDRQAIPAKDRAVLTGLPTDGRPHTRSVGHLGAYRLLATRAGDGDVLVTGLPLGPLENTVTWLAVIFAGVAALGLIIATVAGRFIIRHTLEPLRRVAGTARDVAALPLDRGDVALAVRVPAADTDPRTEVGQVGAALNRMLEHVSGALSVRQASETRMRQFLADASHELRTPLAAIRGYAELTRRSHDVVPGDVGYALGRVESEAARMTTLVEDLLLLARLDAGRELDRDTVDLSRMVVDAVNDAHIAGPGHHWRLDLPDIPLLVSGDPAKLQQVLVNLLANARTHTPPGTTVTTSLAADGGQAVLRVADDGPGIPAALQPEVFERFARGDNSRSRGSGSTGLGLAIVAAVTAAHHGSCAVRSEPGDTAFTVRLPLAEPVSPTAE